MFIRVKSFCLPFHVSKAMVLRRVGYPDKGGTGRVLSHILAFSLHNISRLDIMIAVDFEIVGEVTRVETIASGIGVRERVRLSKQYGQGRWRKLKGVAHVRLVDGALRLAEIHWYEAHGIGKIEYKLKLPFLNEKP